MRQARTTMLSWGVSLKLDVAWPVLHQWVHGASHPVVGLSQLFQQSQELGLPCFAAKE